MLIMIIYRAFENLGVDLAALKKAYTMLLDPIKYKLDPIK